MGPFIFNIFSNNLLLLLEKNCNVFNYADDTRILCKHRDYDSAYNDLLSSASTMVHWYKMNYMQKNPENCQFIIIDKERQLKYNFAIESQCHHPISIKCKIVGCILSPKLFALYMNDCPVLFHIVNHVILLMNNL